MFTRSILLTLCLTFTGCAIGRASGSLYDIPRERATECQDICTKLDLQMAAVVVIMNTTGCVCEPKGAHAGAAPGAVGTSGGAAGAAAKVIATQLANQQARLSH